MSTGDATIFRCSLGLLDMSVQQPGGGLISGMGTGALVWTASLELAMAIVEAGVLAHLLPIEALGSVRAIELGCGCSALPSLALALVGARDITATDTHDVLTALQPNLASYAAAAARAGVNPDVCGAVAPSALSWVDRAALATLARDDGFGLVLCADVDWMEELHQALVDALTACLAPSSSSVALIATSSSGRDRERTLRSFLKLVGARGLALTELSHALEPLAQGAAAAASKADLGGGGARFFAARWSDEATARTARAQLVERTSTLEELLGG